MTYLPRDQFVEACGGPWQAVDVLLAEPSLTPGQKLTLLGLFRVDGPMMRRRPGCGIVGERIGRDRRATDRDLRRLQSLGIITKSEGDEGGRIWLYRVSPAPTSCSHSPENRAPTSRPMDGAPCRRSAPTSRRREVEEVEVEEAPPTPKGGSGVRFASPNGNGNGNGPVPPQREPSELRLALDHFATLTDEEQVAAMDAVPQHGRVPLQSRIVRQIAALNIWRVQNPEPERNAS